MRVTPAKCGCLAGQLNGNLTRQSQLLTSLVEEINSRIAVTILDARGSLLSKLIDEGSGRPREDVSPVKCSSGLEV